MHKLMNMLGWLLVIGVAQAQLGPEIRFSAESPWMAEDGRVIQPDAVLGDTWRI